MTTLVIVGTGLIGGSVARAARDRGVVDTIIGVDTSAATLRAAGTLGIVDEECTSLTEAAARADLVVICSPVDTVAERALTAARAARPGTLITDAASTKASIVQQVEAALPEGITFVGGHPLAGSEQNGPGFADADLFRGKLVLLTPSPRTPADALNRVVGFWKALGADVKCIDAELHDRALGLTSHLPHVVASALAAILPTEWQGLAASGFRDTTRIAGGSSRVWLPILQDNRANVLTALQLLRAQLDAFAAALAANDTQRLEQLLQQGRQSRRLL